MKNKLEKDQYTKSEVEQLLTETTDEVQDQMDVMKAELSLSAEQSAYYKSLTTDDEKGDFLTITDVERDALVSKKADTVVSDVVYTTDSGIAYTKSDDPRLVTMAKERDADRRELARANARTEHVELAKQAGEDLCNLPGTEVVHVAILKALGTIADVKIRDEALTVLKSHNTAMGEAYSKSGNPGGGKDPEGQGNDANDKLEALVTKHRDANPEVSYSKAYDLVANANKELYAAAIQEG